MLVVAVVALVVVPIIELWVIAQVGGAIGILETLALLILVALVGGWLVKREGLGVARRVQAAARAGRVPTPELVDGLFVVVAGVLLVAPGFVTDVVALLLLLRPVRAGARAMLLRRFRQGRPASSSGVIDLP